MPHGLRNLPNASHEGLTIALVAGAVSALVMLVILVYLLWRDRKKLKTPKAVRGRPRRGRKKKQP